MESGEIIITLIPHQLSMPGEGGGGCGEGGGAGILQEDREN